MRHIPEGTLRRLVDEPLAVADARIDHLAHCHRCSHRREQIARDAVAAAALLARPQPVPDVDDGWRRLQGRLYAPQAEPAQATARPHRRRLYPRRHWRFIVLPAPSAAVMATLAVVLAGGAAAAVLTTVFAPTRVVPVKVSSGDLQAIADAAGVEGSGVLGGFETLSGSQRVAFGVVSWTAAGRAHPVASIAAADEETGIDVRLPAALPAGVGPEARFVVQPEVKVSITFDARAGRALDRTSLTITGGPAVLVEFGSSTGGLGLPALATFAMERPVASSTGATAAQLEAFVLSRPGLPPALAQEIRLLGNLRTTLPVPTPAGADVSQVDVGGSPGVLVSEGAGAASGVIWEDRGGVVHAVLGLLDQADILHVADQLG